MKEKIIIIALLLLAIYLYQQNQKLKSLPATTGNSETIFEVKDNGDHEDLIAEKDLAIRQKNEAEQEALALNNRLKLKQQEVTRKETEIERLKKEKNLVEVNLNQKITELKAKYSKQGQLLDTEQLECKKLEELVSAKQEKVESLEEEITELQVINSQLSEQFQNEKSELFNQHQSTQETYLQKIGDLEKQLLDLAKSKLKGKKINQDLMKRLKND